MLPDKRHTLSCQYQSLSRAPINCGFNSIHTEHTHNIIFNLYVFDIIQVCAVLVTFLIFVVILIKVIMNTE